MLQAGGQRPRRVVQAFFRIGIPHDDFKAGIPRLRAGGGDFANGKFKAMVHEEIERVSQYIL